jgi:hypothetical protein
MKKIISLMLFVMFVFTGCTTYRYVPPTSLAGQQCVQKCLATQQGCLKDATIKADAMYKECKSESDTEYATCKSKEDTEYIACLKYSTGDNKKKCKEAKQCHKKTCYNSANTSTCSSYYDMCFQSCGGRKEEVK